MKILVTGGAGFIGSAFIRKVINESESIIVNFDKLTYAGKLENLYSIDKSERYSFVQGDICNYDEIYSVVQKNQPDLIVNFAAETHVDRSISGPSNFIKTNINGTFNVLEVVRDYFSKLRGVKLDNFRFMHISTDEVYGDLPHPDQDVLAGTLKFSESTPYNPSSPYSASKAASDHLVKSWGRTYGLPVFVTNCSNNYGPFQDWEKLIPNTIRKSAAGELISIYGNGQQIRDWLHVDDHVEALFMILKCGQVGETYNIGGGKEARNIEIVDAICTHLDNVRENYKFLRNVNVKNFSQLKSFVADRAGHDVRYSVDISKIRDEVGWEPQRDIISEIGKTVDWYLEKLNSSEEKSLDQ